ncbi:MAG: hypothetical protein GY851_14625 [bacterium]|nr:hypothetical protein [bacterium]
MKYFMLALSTLLVACVLGAYAEESDGPVYRIETRLYEVDQQAMGSRDLGAGLAEEWVAAGDPPHYATPLNNPYVAVKAGEEACVRLRSGKVQYFERRPDYLYELKFDGAFIGYDLWLRVTPSGESEEHVHVRVRLELSEVTSREPIKGVALDVGRPVIARREHSAELVVEPGKWYQTVHPSAGISTLLLAMKVYPFDFQGHKSQPPLPQYSVETKVLRFRPDAFPAAQHPTAALLYDLANPETGHTMRVVKKDTVPDLLSWMDEVARRTESPGLVSAPRLTTLLLSEAEAVAAQANEEAARAAVRAAGETVTTARAGTEEARHVSNSFMAEPDIAWVMDQPGGKPAVIAVLITQGDPPEHRGITLGFCPERLEDGGVSLAMGWHVHPPKPAKRGGILGLFQSEPEDFSPFRGHLKQELGNDEALLVGGRIPETRDVFILIVEGDRIEWTGTHFEEVGAAPPRQENVSEIVIEK